MDTATASEAIVVVTTNEAMVSAKLFIICISTMFLAIIGIYVWTFLKLSDIYKVINGHMQQANIHTDKSEFVQYDVCQVVHKQVDTTLQEIKKDVKTLLTRGGNG